MNKLYLGIDGGGSHTRLSIINSEDQILVQETGASTNLNILGSEEVSKNLSDLLVKGLTHIDSDHIHGCFALSGVNFPSDLKNWQQIIAKNPRILSLFKSFPIIINDTKAALRSGTTSKDAVVIISGTGSNCFGRNNKGEESSSGGVDYILSDQGSGYSIGLNILQAITKQLDGRAPKTILTDSFFKAYKIKTLEQLSKLVYTKPWNKTDIAQVEILLEQALLENDKIASDILNFNIEELLKMLNVVIKNLKLEDKMFDLVTSGSVLIKNKIFRQKFITNIEKIYPKAKVLKPNIDQSQAAALLARETTNLI